MAHPLRKRSSGASPTEVRLVGVEGIDDAVQSSQGPSHPEDGAQGHPGVAVLQAAQSVSRDVGTLGNLDSGEVLHPPPVGEMGADLAGRPCHPDRRLLRRHGCVAFPQYARYTSHLNL